MSTGKPRDVQKEHFWRKAIRRWRSSGLSVHAYCQQCGLSKASFYSWRRTLAARDAEAASFAAVQILPDEPPVVSAQSSNAALVLLLANHRVLQIAPGFDAATLRQLLPVLEEGRSC